MAHPALACGDRLTRPGLHDLGDVVIAKTQVLANERAGNQSPAAFVFSHDSRTLRMPAALGNSIELIRHYHTALCPGSSPAAGDLAVSHLGRRDRDSSYARPAGQKSTKNCMIESASLGDD